LVGSETVGSVTLTADGGTGANDTAGVYIITPSAATGGTFTAANYNINYQPGMLTVAGQAFGDWGAGLSDPSPGADSDGNGLANLVEYFFGMQPGGDATGVMSIGEPAATSFYMEYRRGKNTQGVSSVMKWKNALTDANWSADGVTDVFVSDEGDHEIRRATAPLLTGEQRKFLRLEVWQE
jgi:hypothetical protein